MSGPLKSCRTCWFAGMEPKSEIGAYDPEGPMRWTCALDRRPAQRPFVCTAHAPDQDRAPTYTEIQIARNFRSERVPR